MTNILKRGRKGTHVEDPQAEWRTLCGIDTRKDPARWQRFRDWPTSHVTCKKCLAKHTKTPARSDG